MECSVQYPYITFTINQQCTIREFFQSFHLSKKTIYLYNQNQLYSLNDHFCSLDTVMHMHDLLKIKAYKEDDGMYPPIYGELDVAYEDDYILVVNKPPYINVYPDDSSKTDSLSNIVSYYYKKHHLNIPVRYIHRLDEDTSGLVLYVKCSFIQPMLDLALANKEIHRDYLAIVEGTIPKGKKKRIKSPIGEDRHHKSKMRVSRNGKNAETFYECLKSNQEYSLIRCSLLTGRKHQIRVHLSYTGHPLVGDLLYGHPSPFIHRQALHGYALTFNHPIFEKEMNVKSNLPEDFEQLLKIIED